jgi:hypothetical protein
MMRGTMSFLDDLFTLSQNASQKVAFLDKRLHFMSYLSPKMYSTIKMIVLNHEIELEKIIFTFIEEPFVTFPVPLFLEANSPFHDVVDKAIQWMLNGGIMQYFLNLQIESIIVEKISESLDAPKILNFEDLSYGFVFWLGSCGLSTIFLLLEILKYTIEKNTPKLIGGMVLLMFITRRHFI